MDRLKWQHFIKSDYIYSFLRKHIPSYKLNDNGDLILYHFSPEIIKNPNIHMSKTRGERGIGFYMFLDAEYAVMNNSRNHEYINYYIFNIENYSKYALHINSTVEFHYDSNISKYIRVHRNELVGHEYMPRMDITINTGVSEYCENAGGQFIIHAQDIIYDILCYVDTIKVADYLKDCVCN